MARQNVEQKGYGIAMHRNELKSEGRARNSRAERGHNNAIHRLEWTSKGNEVRRIDTQVRSEEGRAPKSKNKNEKEKATCRKSK